MDQWFISLVDQFDGYGIALYVLLTCLISGLLASTFGMEREFRGQAAGLRTHVLVSIACCLLMSLSIYAIRRAITGTEFSSLTYDASRIAAGILSGVGFIGAGTIIKNGLNIRGLTTAATLWLVAALGMACGCGYILEALIATFLSMFFLISLGYLERYVEKKSPTYLITIRKIPDVELKLKNEARNFDIVVKYINIISETKQGDDTICTLRLGLAFKTSKAMLHSFEERLHSETDIISVNLLK
jgi:putative Mg2+ transporter-C (MgtC) family protein